MAAREAFTYVGRRAMADAVAESAGPVAAECAAPTIAAESRVVEQVVKDSLQQSRRTSNQKVSELESKISEWLGNETKLVYNKARDPVFISKDSAKRVRFDFNNPHGDKPHMHFEQKINSNWKDAKKQHRIYPKNQ